MTMTTKIEKIRRKLNENKKKDILQSITVNQNLSNLLFRSKEQIADSYRKKHLAILPSSPLCHSIDLSTDHSEQSSRLGHSHTLAVSSDFRRAQHSVLTQKKERKGNHLNVELTTKSLNPTVRINWNTRTNNRTATERENTSNNFINTQTPSTVIIVTDSQSSLKLKKSFRSVLKRHSFV